MRFGYTSERRILDGVSFESAAGEVVAVLGNNGAGKSTLIKCMDRILTPETGAVLVDGTDLLSLTRREHARCAAYVPQTPPKGSLTVFDAVLLGRRPYITWDATAHDKEVVDEALELLRLKDYALRRVDELSGGEQQKVAIARPWPRNRTCCCSTSLPAPSTRATSTRPCRPCAASRQRKGSPPW